MSNVTNQLATGFTLPEIDPSSPMPLYHQIFENLSQRIHAGEFINGFRLPSENELAAKLGVSRITVKRAFSELAATGLVLRRRGKGTQVSLNTALVVKGGVMDMTSNITALRQSTKAKLISRSNDGIPDFVRPKLDVSTNDALEKIVHQLILNDKAVSLTFTYGKAKVLSQFTDIDIERKSLIVLMNQANIRVTRAEQTISAIAATRFHADAFKIPIGSPLLEIQCLMKDQYNRPCQFVMSYFRSELYQYAMTLM